MQHMQNVTSWVLGWHLSNKHDWQTGKSRRKQDAGEVKRDTRYMHLIRAQIYGMQQALFVA